MERGSLPLPSVREVNEAAKGWSRVKADGSRPVELKANTHDERGYELERWEYESNRTDESREIDGEGKVKGLNADKPCRFCSSSSITSSSLFSAFDAIHIPPFPWQILFRRGSVRFTSNNTGVVHDDRGTSFRKGTFVESGMIYGRGKFDENNWEGGECVLVFLT